YRYFRCRGRKTYHMRVEFLEVKRWFENRGRSGLFGFENLCETLGIDSEALRNSLERCDRDLSKLDSKDSSLTQCDIAKLHKIVQLGRRRDSHRSGRATRVSTVSP